MIRDSVTGPLHTHDDGVQYGEPNIYNYLYLLRLKYKHTIQIAYLPITKKRFENEIHPSSLILMCCIQNFLVSS